MSNENHQSPLPASKKRQAKIQERGHKAILPLVQTERFKRTFTF